MNLYPLDIKVTFSKRKPNNFKQIILHRCELIFLYVKNNFFISIKFFALCSTSKVTNWDWELFLKLEKMRNLKVKLKTLFQLLSVFLTFKRFSNFNCQLKFVIFSIQCNFNDLSAKVLKNSKSKPKSSDAYFDLTFPYRITESKMLKYRYQQGVIRYGRLIQCLNYVSSKL